MTSISTQTLFIILGTLVILSGFFSSSETGMMAINRYRLRHLARIKHKGALRVQGLLERPDRLISLILIGNNFVNILASAIATIIAVRLLGDIGIAVSTVLLTLVILIFAEVTPKTIAAIYPERIAFPAAFILTPLMKISSPMVTLTNAIVNVFLKVLRVNPKNSRKDELSREELRTLLRETGRRIPAHYQQMLIGILDLDSAAVEDIMVPKTELVGIDLDDEWDVIVRQLVNSQHTRLPVYRGHFDNVVGVIHARSLLHHIQETEMNKEHLIAKMQDPYFIPEGTSLITQLQKFQTNKNRMGFVVDEYGDLLGLVTVDDILEEVVGEFTTDSSEYQRNLQKLPDGSVQVPGNITIRELNRAMEGELPIDGPNTLNGLILETLESIPRASTSLLIDGYPIEIVKVKDNKVKTAKIFARQSADLEQGSH